MSVFSLLNVTAVNPDGTVDGYWIQDHVGSHASALEKAEVTASANSNRITVAVVEQILCPVASLGFWPGRRIAYSGRSVERRDR